MIAPFVSLQLSATPEQLLVLSSAAFHAASVLSLAQPQAEQPAGSGAQRLSEPGPIELW